LVLSALAATLLTTLSRVLLLLATAALALSAATLLTAALTGLLVLLVVATTLAATLTALAALLAALIWISHTRLSLRCCWDYSRRSTTHGHAGSRLHAPSAHNPCYVRRRARCFACNNHRGQFLRVNTSAPDSRSHPV
jgi:hypothetical protein